MKIIINGMLLSGVFSGVENAIYHLAAALAAHGTESCELIAPAHCPAPDLTGPRFRTTRIELAWPSRWMRIFWEQCRLGPSLRSDRADLCHAPGYIAPLAARIPVVLTVYDLIALQHPGWCTALNALHYRLMLPLSVRKAARIVVPSCHTRNALIRHRGDAEPKIGVIPLGIDQAYGCEPEGPDEGAQLRATYGLPQRYILFVGNIEPKKNVERLIQAYALMLRQHDVKEHLVLAGARGASWSRVQRAIRAQGLQEQVHVPGFIAAQDLAGLYRAASLFVFPSLAEGFGLPPLEAMACGIPVICSNRGALPEMTGAAALSVDPLNPAALSEAMYAVLQSEDLRRDLTARGLEHVRPFTWQRHAKAVEAVYRSVAATSCPHECIRP